MEGGASRREVGWKGGATGKCRDPRERKAEIESEWAEWQKRQAEQQANAEIDPRERSKARRERLRDPPFISPVV